MLSLRVTYAIQLLSELEQSSRRGERVTITELKTRCALESSGVSHVLLELRRKGWVDQIKYRHFLIRDLTKTTLYDLVIAMDDEIRLGTYCVMDLWSHRNRDRHQKAIDLERQLSGEVEQRLKGIMISDLFACEKVNLKRTRSRIPRTPNYMKATDVAAE